MLQTAVSPKFQKIAESFCGFCSLSFIYLLIKLTPKMTEWFVFVSREFLSVTKILFSCWATCMELKLNILWV